MHIFQNLQINISQCLRTFSLLTGNKIDEFIEEMSRQVAEMSKEVEQKCAGSLVRLLIRNKEIPKDNVSLLLTVLCILSFIQLLRNETLLNTLFLFCIGN